jgi:deoxycytidylate deaminase
MSNYNDRIKSAAIKSAKISQHEEQVGAVIVKGRRMLSSGYNSTKTHAIIQREIDPRTLVDKLHAELHAVLSAQTDISGAKMYIARISPGLKNGTGLSRPCKLCMAFLKKSGIKEIHYTTGEDDMPWKQERVERH